MKAIPEAFLDLFTKRAFAHLSTLMPDGSPQVSPVWVGYEDGYLIVNTAIGRQKERNIRSDARVALEVQDPDDPYRYILVRGKVVDKDESHAQAGIDKLSMRYRGEKYRHLAPDEIRIQFRIEPLHITTSRR